MVPPPPRPRRRRWPWIILIALGVPSALLAAAWLLRGALFAEPLADAVADRLGQALGGGFSAERVEGSWITDAELVALRTERAPEHGPVAHLAFDRLAVDYAPLELASGGGLEALRGLRIEGLALELDFARPPAPTGPPGAGDSVSQPLRLPSQLPALDVRGRIGIRLPLGGGRTGTLRLDSITLAGDRGRARLTVAGIALPELGITQASWTATLERLADGRWHLAAAEPLAGIQPTRLDWDGTRLSGELAVAGGHLAIETAEGGLGVRLAAIDAAKLPRWLRSLAPARLPNLGTVDATVSWRDGALAVEGQARGLGIRPAPPLRELRIDAGWKAGVLTLRQVELSALWVSATIRDLAIDTATRWPVASTAHIELAIPDLGAFAAMLGRPQPWLGGRPPLALRVAADGDASGRWAPITAVLSGEGVSLAIEGSATVPAAPDWRRIAVDARWSGTLADGAFAAMDGWGGTGSVQGSVAGELADLRGAASATASHVQIAGHRIGEVQLAAAVADGTARIEQLAIAHAGGGVSLAGAFDWRQRRLERTVLELDAADLAAVASHVPGAPEITGRLRATVEADGTWPAGVGIVAALRTLDLRCKAEAEHLVVAGRQLGAARLDATSAGGVLRVVDAELDGPWRVSLAGTAEAIPGGVTVALERFAAVTAPPKHDATLAAPDAPPAPPVAEVAVRLIEPATARWTPGAWSVRPARFAAAGGQLHLAAKLDGELDVQVRAVRVRPWALLPVWAPRIDGSVSGTFAARGDPAAPLASLRLRSIGLRVAGRGALVAVDAEQDATGVRVQRCEARIGGALAMRATASLPTVLGMGGMARREGQPLASLDAWAAVVPGLLPKRPGMPEVGCARLTARIDERGARAGLSVRELLVHVPPIDDDLEPMPDEIAELDVVAEAGAQGWRATLRAHDTGGLALEGEGRGAAAYDPAKPWAFLAALVADDLDGRLAVRQAQLARLQPLLPQLVRLEGILAGELRVGGRPLMPRWDGMLQLERGGLKARSDVPAISDGRGRVLLEGTRVTIEELSARMGYAPVRVTGSVDLGNFQPAFDLALSGENALLLRNQNWRLRADCALRLHGPIETMELSGSVRITDALYSKPFELLSRLRPSGGGKSPRRGIKLFSLRERPLSAMALDVDILGTQSLRVRTDVFAGDVSIDLHLTGSGESPIPRGRAWSEDARLRMPFTSLRVVHAEVTFAGDDPFLPRLEASGEARMKGYDLRVHASGELPDVEVTVESDPPLTTSEGVMLLTTGMTGTEREDERRGRAELAMVGKYLAKELWSEVSGPGDPDAVPGLLDLDRLSLAVGQQLTETGENTIDAEYELSSRFHLHGERDRYDDYNIGLVWRLRRR